jgi:hypothetical protein
MLSLGLVISLPLLFETARPPKRPPAPATETAPAAAEPSGQPTAAEAKARGDAALVAGRPAEALKEYDAALTLSSDPALFYNRARALQALERFPEATRELERFAAESSPELRARVPKLDALLLEVRTKSSALDVKCSVPGAEVHVDATLLGKTPIGKRVDLNTGKVTLKVTHPDFHPFTRVIDLPPAGVALVEVTLNPLATTGLLRVNSSVPNADLVIDDAPRGTTPFEGYLTLGAHKVQVSSDGHQTAENAVVITSTEVRLLDVDLPPIPKIYQRWWFWTAIIAVVAAGTVTAVALNVERAPTEGSLGITSVGPAH